MTKNTTVATVFQSRRKLRADRFGNILNKRVNNHKIQISTGVMLIRTIPSNLY